MMKMLYMYYIHSVYDKKERAKGSFGYSRLTILLMQDLSSVETSDSGLALDAKLHVLYTHSNVKVSS